MTPYRDRSGAQMEAKYFFEKLHISESVATMAADGSLLATEEKDVETTIDIDEFIVHLWRSGTVSGIKTEDIKGYLAQ